jgi:hypothetical protein
MRKLVSEVTFGSASNVQYGLLLVIISLNVVIIQLSFILYFSTFQIVESSTDVLSLSLCVSTLLNRDQQFGNMRS